MGDPGVLGCVRLKWVEVGNTGYSGFQEESVHHNFGSEKQNLGHKTISLYLLSISIP